MCTLGAGGLSFFSENRGVLAAKLRQRGATFMRLCSLLIFREDQRTDLWSQGARCEIFKRIFINSSKNSTTSLVFSISSRVEIKKQDHTGICSLRGYESKLRQWEVKQLRLQYRFGAFFSLTAQSSVPRNRAKNKLE